MRIAIPADGNKKEVCASFGRAPYLMFYDTDTKGAEFRANPAADAAGGAGLKAAQFIADGKAQAVITFRCGENAAEVLKASGIDIYKAAGPDAAQNIKAFEEKRLEKLTRFHAGFHWGGK